MSIQHKSGIYIIRQLGTDRCYIGSSKAIRNRWYQHRKLLDQGRHHSVFMQNAWIKHGGAAFKFEILEECSVEMLIIREQYYIDKLKPEFNVCPFARSRLGSKQRPEVRARLIAQIKARQNAKTHCPKGHEYTPENTAISVRGARLCRRCNRERVAAKYASETPEQTAARLAKGREYIARKGEERLAKVRAYGAANRSKIRAKRAARRARLNAMGPPKPVKTGKDRIRAALAARGISV